MTTQFRIARSRAVVALAATVAVASLGIVDGPASADTATGTVPFAQSWSDPAQIAVDDDWSGVPSVVGYRGDGLAASANTDPQTILTDGSATPIDIDAQSTATSTAGGVHEIEAGGVVALQGSGTADAPHIVVRLDTTAKSTIAVAYSLVDLDADDGGAQQIALQYRVGATGDFTNVPAGYIADASTTPPASIAVAVVLPAAADNQPVVDVRIITTDTTGADSMTGVDDISITADGTPPPPPPPPPPTAKNIAEVQGTGATTPLAGQIVTIAGVVTSQLERQDVLDGFFVQEEDSDADGDAATSNGVFVFCRSVCPTALATGDVVTVTGTAVEAFGMTQLAVTATSDIVVGSSANPLPTAVAVDLPAAGATNDAATFEATEGMIGTVTQTLAVSEYFNLARFGEITLTAQSRPFQFTYQSAPSVDGYASFRADLATRRIILDDDNNDNNDAISNGPDEASAYPTGGLSTTNRFRGGDTITGLTGVLHWSFAGATGTDAWRIRPIDGTDYTFAPANPAPPVPTVDGRLRVASFNVLNYFTTIDTTSSNSVGTCGPSGTVDCRGADSAAELTQQRAKIVSAMTALDADILGLIEIQNDAGTSTDDLVAGLNAVSGAGTYDAIDTGVIGTDAIKVALVYRPGIVTPIGAPAILDSSDDPTFIDTANRPTLIQTFEEIATGERFTVAVNHFKSKGSACTPLDPDANDGQGNCNLTRATAAQALTNHLATDPTGSGDPDFLVIGDLNSYRMEDPITTIEAAGYTDLVKTFEGDEGYSFVFDGQLGYLDHALANASLLDQVTGTATWSINADEVPLFDYNDSIADPGEASFERETTVGELDATDAARSSDHDPVVIGLDLGGDIVVPDALTIDQAVISLGRNGGGTALFSGRISGMVTQCPRLVFAIDGATTVDAQSVPIGRGTTCITLTGRGLVTFDVATSTVSGVAFLPRSFTLADDTVDFTLTVDGVVYGATVAGTRIGRLWTGASPPT